MFKTIEERTPVLIRIVNGHSDDPLSEESQECTACSQDRLELESLASARGQPNDKNTSPKTPSFKHRDVAGEEGLRRKSRTHLRFTNDANIRISQNNCLMQKKLS